jgi:phytoene synthase
VSDALETLGAPGSDLYYSLIGTPPGPRSALIALHAAHAEVLEIPSSCSDPAIARMKLGWWREECARWMQGEPRHPCGRPIVRAGFDLGACGRSIATAVDGIELGLGQPVPAALSDLTAVWAATTGMLWSTWTELAGGSGADRERAAALGTTTGHYQTLCGIRADLRAGRVRLPAEDFAAAGATLADLVHRPASEPVVKLLARQVERIESGYAAALATVAAPAPVALRGPIRHMAIARATLAEIAADGYAVLTRRVTLTPLRKLWIAWRAHPALS